MPLPDSFWEVDPEPPRPVVEEPEIDPRQAAIAKMIGSTKGRAKLAASMAGYIRDRLNRVRVSRHRDPVQLLPDGAPLIYDKDPPEGVGITQSASR